MSSFGGNGTSGGGGGGGDASAANQVTGNASLASIDTKTPSLVSGRQPVDGSGVTQPVSAASLPLPSGAATSALQTTGNTSLSSISTSVSSLDTKTPSLASGRVPVDGSGVTQPVSGTINAAAPVWSRTATGAITAVASGTIKNSSGRLRAVRILYAGSGTSYFQLHDKLTATSFSDSTLLGFGFTISATNNTLILDFSEELVMSTGICWALSSTQATYTSTVQTAYVFAEYI